MTRNQKQNRLAVEAMNMVNELKQGARPFFGNDGVTFHADGRAGDVVGHLINRAGLTPKDPYSEMPAPAVARALGVRVENLPQELQLAINHLACVSDDTKRAYSRRVPRLVKALTDVAASLTSTNLVNSTSSKTSAFTVTGAMI